jgi:hypothetical protein
MVTWHEVIGGLEYPLSLDGEVTAGATAAVTFDQVVGSGGGSGGPGDPSPDFPYGVPGAWTKVFEDNFDGTTLDINKWSDMDGATMNNVTTSGANIAVSGGELRLTLSNSSTGAFISSSGFDGAVDGYLLPVGGVAEARVWFPGNGTELYNWSAWWTSGSDWPTNGEHDIAEILESGDLTVNYHYGDFGSPISDNQRPNPSGYWGDAWHIYTLHRKSTSADVYWDGVLVHSYATSDAGGDHSLLLNVGATGDSGLDRTGSTGVMRVDYVRAWEPA